MKVRCRICYENPVEVDGPNPPYVIACDECLGNPSSARCKLGDHDHCRQENLDMKCWCECHTRTK